MRAVIDTNVIAYLVLGTPRFVQEVAAFWARTSEVLAPSLWQAEFANVMSMAARSDTISDKAASQKLYHACRLSIISIATVRLWDGALRRSINFEISAYDALFVELAAKENLPLVTFDKKLIAKFPDIACRPAAMS